MFNLNSYFKFLSKNKLYTLVNVVGLSISLMFVILIASYTANQFSTDNFHENADEIYVMCNNEHGGSAYKIGERIEDRYPEIEKTCGVIWVYYGNAIPVEIADNRINAQIMTVDPTFLDMFSFELLSGDRNTALDVNDNVLISESFAKKIFDNQNPIGRHIIIDADSALTFTVVGIIEDFKNTMFRPADIIMRVENMAHFNPGTISETFNMAGATTLFIQTAHGENLQAKQGEIAEYFSTFYWLYENGIYDKVFFTPIRDFYFSDLNVDHYQWNGNNKMMLTILVFIGSLILLFAIINYINLTVAQTGFRAKETATRQLFGASKASLFVKMIFESSFLCFVAFLIGAFLAFIAEPYANTLIGVDIYLANNITFAGGLLFILFIAILGIISGIIPAIIISRFKPIDVVKGSFTFKSKLTFSKVFITIQSIITIILIACSITIYRQVDYLISYDYGYNSKAIINVSTTSIWGKEMQLRDKLKSLAFVKNVGLTNGTPVSRGSNSTMTVEGVKDPISFQVITADSATIQMLGIEFLKNNNLADEGCWINEEGLRLLEANEDLKSFKNEYGEEFKIAGIIKEFHIGNLVLHAKKEPLLFYIDNDLTSPWNVLVEVQGDLTKAFREVKAVYEEISDGLEFTGKYIDQEIEESYQEQRRMQIIMILFTIVAIVISSLGLIAISSYFIQQRSREIAVRKVFGSTSTELLIRVIWEFIRLVFVAFLIASPIVWVVMNKWLSEFPHRIDMSIWILLAAGIINLFIAFLTVYWQSSLAVNANPTKSVAK